MYRIITASQPEGQPKIDLATTSVAAGKKIRETMPEVEDLTIVRNNFNHDAHADDRIIPVSGLWADQSFFKVFTFPLIAGNATTVLKDPYSLIITEKSALKLFGHTSVLGKTIKFDTTDYVITGVMKDLPKFSHIQFDVLASFSTLEQHGTKDSDGNLLDWASIYSNYVYVTLRPNAYSSTLQANLDQLSERENKTLQHHKIFLSLQPLGSIALGKALSNSIGPYMPSIVVWILAGLALVVILSACFNYTNLSIARAMRRSREVGIRKVIGASRVNVASQFIAESVVVSLLALIFSVLLFLALRNEFLSLDSFLERVASLELSLKTILLFILFAIFTGLLSGILPSLFFARINAVKVLKDISSLTVFKRVTLRKVLIVTQYTFSLIFITASIIGFNQYKSFLAFDLGFKTDNILNIRMQNNNSDLLRKELSEMREVKDIAVARLITSLGSYQGSQMKYAQDSDRVWLNFVDEHYLPMHEHRLIAGRNFLAKAPGSEETEVIVNEQLLKRFNIASHDAAKAIGEVIEVDKKHLTIIGVLKDFHYGTVESTIDPTAFRYSTNEPGGYLTVKVNTTDMAATLATIDNVWKKIDTVHPLDAHFYNDQIEQAYAQFAVMAKVIGFLAFLAVGVASMGLFGMVVFTTETRRKEISIRKVLGAKEGSLIYLLSKSFLTLLLLAALIALPMTYLFFNNVVLINFAYHQPIGWPELLSGACIIFLIAIVMIGSQTWKAARSNPAEVLKSE
jgi:ABC-type antimicrobial peptide transport system permease subunit